MRPLLPIVILSAACLTVWAKDQSQEPPKAKPAKQQSKTERRGSEKSPFFIKATSPNTQAERDYETYEKYEKPANERRITTATIALAGITGFLALFTGGLWFATYRLSKEAKKSAKRQVPKMEASIAEAIRSASAMEEVANATKNNAALLQGMLSK